MNMGRVSRQIMAAVFACACFSCGPSLFMQEDGFREKLTRPCSTVEACDELEAEASRRVQGCKENTVGYVRCADARADLETVKRWVSKLKKADEDAAEAARAASNKKDREQAVEQAREQRAEQWLERVVSNCERLLTDDGCKAGPSFVQEQDVDRCREACRERIAVGQARLFERAVARCAARVSNSRGEAPTCDLDLPEGSSASLDARRTECLDKCVERAKDAERRRVELEGELAGDAGAPKPASPAPTDNRPVKCCDGSLSQSCTCGGSVRGCCSRHGGVCGCGD